MNFLIADTFTDSLARLSGAEQKAAKVTVADLQLNPAMHGTRLHKLDRARDKNFWSARVNDGIRIIVHWTASSLLLCFVGHHDVAYPWAERRKIETHPTTGAAQLVEIRETVREVIIPKYVESEEASAKPEPPVKLAAASASRPFASMSDADLLSFGVPPEWIEDVQAADEEAVLGFAGHLPPAAFEALMEIATGGTPERPVVAAAGTDPFAHPDAQRTFRLVETPEELQRALDYPWDKWLVFLHPAQREMVERSYGGPARVSGSAGTGKTIVAIHRAAALARRNPKTRVLLTTFTDTLASALKARLGKLVGNEAGVLERITVRSIDGVGIDLHTEWFGAPDTADAQLVKGLIGEASRAVGGHKFSDRLLESEWHEVVDAWQLGTWEAYRDVTRLGRKTRLGEKQRAVLWAIFEKVRAGLAAEKLVTIPAVFARVTEGLKDRPRPFDCAIVDEAQDIGVPHLRLLAALGDGRADSLFFAGDLGQRIFQTPFSWLALGIDIRGRSQTLRTNYRTSHQIRRQADRLLPGEIADVDGVAESRRGTVSVFNGAEPTIERAESEAAEATAIGAWIRERVAQGCLPQEIGVFVRSAAQLPRAEAGVRAAGLAAVELDEGFATTPGKVTVSTMHLAKGLEFRAVVVAACDDEVLPLQERIEAVSDDADLEEVYNTERHLLYVACTRARDSLLVTGVEPVSEFVDDLND